MNKFYLILIVIVFVTVLAASETIYLKNGDIVSGKITEIKVESIIVETTQGTLEILKENIEKIEYAETSDLKKRNSAFIFRPLPTLLGALLGYLEIVFEGQTAFTKEFAITAIGDIGNFGGIFVSVLQLGPQYRPKGDYLQGFILGLYPGIAYATDYVDTFWFFTLTFETGYQWVLDSGFVLGLTTGGSYIGGNPYAQIFKFNASAHLGFAFEDPWIKAK